MLYLCTHVHLAKTSCPNYPYDVTHWNVRVTRYTVMQYGIPWHNVAGHRMTAMIATCVQTDDRHQCLLYHM